MINEDVVVVFENCETAYIPKEKVAVLWFGDVTENISYTYKGIQTKKVAKEMSLAVEYPKPSFVARCKKHKDITQIQVGLETYYIEWPNEDFSDNWNQQNWYYDNSILIRVEPKGENYYE